MAKSENRASETSKDPLEYLAHLQKEADKGFHRDLQAWVDDSSSVAKVLRALAAR